MTHVMVLVADQCICNLRFWRPDYVQNFHIQCIPYHFF